MCGGLACVHPQREDKPIGLRQNLENILRNFAGVYRRCCLGSGQIGQHHHELIATEARHGIDLAHTACQPPRCFDEQQITRLVPISVIDRLEVVEVYEPVSYTHLDVYKRQKRAWT